MLNKLSDRKIKAIKDAGRYFDGGGLHLYARTSARNGLRMNWIYRYSIDKKRSDLGLGAYPTVTLSEARAMRERYAKALADGYDPKVVKDTEQSDAALASIKSTEIPTLKAAILEAFEAKKATLKGDGSAGRWLSPMKTHVFPKIGHLRVTDIDQHVLTDFLRPMWRKQYPTATKILNRINITLRHAAADDLDVDLMAVEKAKIKLGAVDHKEQHHPSIPYQMAPKFYQALGIEGREGIIKALMLVGVRAAEVRMARIEAIDWNEAILTTDADHVKGQKQHVQENRIALSGEALRVFRCAAADRTEGYVFRNNRNGPFANTLAGHIRKHPWIIENKVDATAHGMRAACKGFLLEQCPEIPEETIKLVLSHSVETKAGRAYRRTDQIEQQRCALERWGRFLCGDKTPVIDQFSPNEKKFEAQ